MASNHAEVISEQDTDWIDATGVAVCAPQYMERHIGEATQGEYDRLSQLAPVESVMGMSPTEANAWVESRTNDTGYFGVTPREAAMAARNAFYQIHGDRLRGDSPDGTPEPKVVQTADVLDALANREMLIATHRFAVQALSSRQLVAMSYVSRMNHLSDRDTDWRLRQVLESPVTLYPREARLAMDAIAEVIARCSQNDPDAYATGILMSAASRLVAEQTSVPEYVAAA